MKPYFFQIAVVRSAAQLIGFTLKDNYAFLGATSQHLDMDPGVMQEIDGVPEVPVKAESFRFGIRCGKVLAKYLSDYDGEKSLYCDAAAARAFFTTVPAEGLSGKEAEKAEVFFNQAFPALIKRSQIKTHTNKPGFEDINTWLERFYHLQKDLHAVIPEFCHVLVQPDVQKAEQYTAGLIDPAEPLTALAIAQKSADAQTIRDLAAQTGGALFEQILREIVKNELA